MKRIHLKAEAASTGFYYLDHEPTGKVYTGTSTNMQADILAIKAELEGHTSKHKRLTRLFDQEPHFIAKCFPTKGIRAAKKMEKEFREERPSFLLIN